MQLTTKLPSISRAQLGYAIEHGFVHEACVRSAKHHTYYCLECGNTITKDKAVKKMTCPHCGRKLVVGGVRQKSKDFSSMHVITTISGWQVVRTFYLERITRGGNEAVYEVYEPVQRWMQPKKKDIIVALNKVFMPRYIDQYDKFSEMSIKNEGVAITYYGNPYNVTPKVVYPRQSILPELKRNGYCQLLTKSKTFPDVFRLLMDNPKFETIAKAGRYDIWDNLTVGFIEEHWPQIKMMMRHDYYPADYKIWEDTLNMAEEMGRDIHSPKYVLPADLNGLHDTLMRKKNAAEREKEIESHRKYAGQFLKYYKKYLGIIISEGDITIRPLQNFEEFYDEGKAMHHCVATYFGMENSLILTARNGNVRLATIEVNTEDFSVEQCRAMCNKVPERYDEIVNIVASHKADFLRAKRTKKVA